MKIGDKVRTSDPLTECAGYINSARILRRAGAIGHVRALDDGSGHGAFAWVTHANGARAPYDLCELTVVLTAEERAEIRVESTPSEAEALKATIRRVTERALIGETCWRVMPADFDELLLAIGEKPETLPKEGPTLAAAWEALARARGDLMAASMKPRRERPTAALEALAKCEAALRSLRGLGVTL